MQVAQHLDDHIIAAMVAGTLPPIDRERATAHVDSCDSCRDLVGEAALASRPAVPGYVLGAEVARGAMGRIVEARDVELGRSVALKQLIDPTPALIKRFEREVAITAALQHPGIVPVYRAGTLPDGEPFYAMRRVKGRALDLAIAEATTLASRLALLPRILAAIEAVAYAHTEGVVHRDLKPQNILVGDFGEVVVIDWGLAKRFDDDDEPAARETIDPQLTSDGAVLGTPAYMAPEQASARTIDARADVYALGAVLYHALAGKPPHAGATLTETLEIVRAGTIAPLPAEVAPDLRAIVMRAMALAPADRYADAAALAEDVQQFLAGRLVAAHAYTAWQLTKRWIGKHRAWVAAAALIVVGGAVGGAYSIAKIREERDTARVERTSAENLVTYTIGNVSHALEDAGQQEQIDALGKKVVEYYDGVLAVRPNDTVSRAYRAMALDLQANAAFRLGDFDRAKQLWTDTLAPLREAVSVTPDAILDVGRDENNLGNIARLGGDLAGAEKWYRAAIADLEPAMVKEPALVASALAGSLDGIVQLKLGNLDTVAARPLAQRALEVAKAGAQAAPKDDTDANGRLAQIAYSNANVEGMDGHADKARELLAFGIQTLEALPPDPQGVMSIGFQKFTLATVELATAHPDAALASLAGAREAIDAARSSGFEDPQLARLAASVDLETAVVELARGNDKAALAAADNAIAGFAALSAKQPKVVMYKRDHASALVVRARCHPGDAKTSIEAALAELAPLAATPRIQSDRVYAALVAAEIDLDADANLAQAESLLASLPAPAKAPIAHARAFLAAIRAHRDPSQLETYRSARGELVKAIPLSMPTLGELDKLARI